MELLDYERDNLARIRNGLAECMVLLKKNGAFPLDKPCTLAAYGNGVRNSVKGGTGSGDVNAHVVVTIEQGLENAGFRLVGASWLDAYGAKRAAAKKAFYKQLRKEAKAAGMNAVFYALGAIMPEMEYDLPLDYSADAAIYVLSRISGEGADRKPVAGDVLLTQTEIRDILDLSAHYDRFMLVLNTGGPVDLTPVQEVGNILVLSQLGSQMGDVLADVLLGRANPSGKLATTWSAWPDYCPDIQIGCPDDTPYREGIYVGYRYFDTVGKRAAYPFGFGLSYTDFEWEMGSASVEGARVALTARVTNVGPCAGKEVLQAYVSAPQGKLDKPWQELAGFAKTAELQPGETGEVEISFDLRDLASFDEHICSYLLEAGTYVVRLGTSSADTVPVAVLDLDCDVAVRAVRPLEPSADLEECRYARADRTEELGGLPHVQLDPSCLTLPSVAYDVQPSVPVDPVIATLSDEELASMTIGQFSGKGGMLAYIGNTASHVAGAAGETTAKLEDKGIGYLVMADGPAGLRLSREFYRDSQGARSLGAGSIPEGVLDVLPGIVRMFLQLRMGGTKPPRGVKVETQYCTALPVGTAIAQSWNLEFAQVCGDVVGDEMERFGVNLWLAPSLNVHRSILCGRNFEYFSEDPLISGMMAAALVKGVQAHPGCGATVKHFAANNQETNRYFNNSQVSERALREIYLKGFQICVREANPVAVMTSYNLVNGEHTAECCSLSENVLRAESGFSGVIMTDWVIDMDVDGETYGKSKPHRVAAAGGDLFMPGSQADYDDVIAALQDGKLDRHQLEVNATRVLRLINRLSGK